VVEAPIEEDRSPTTRTSPCQGQFAEDPPHATAATCIGSWAGAQVSHQIKHFAEWLPATLIYPGIDIGAKSRQPNRVHYRRASHTATKDRYDL
jgi:hypothetical protein